jgi:hypothetical protein
MERSGASSGDQTQATPVTAHRVAMLPQRNNDTLSSKHQRDRGG